MNNETTNPDSVSPELDPNLPNASALAPDWWRCYRFGPVSGRYEGPITTPNTGTFELDLRIDIDPRSTTAPTMDRVSGDIYQVYSFTWFGRTYRWRVYRESWIIDSPTTAWSRCQVDITGTVRWWSGGHRFTSAEIRIPWSTFRAAGPATVTLREWFRSTSVYNCPRKSKELREITLEVDVCNSVNSAPILPSHDTHSHSDRPASLPARTITIEDAYEDAGIGVHLNPTHTIIDDSASTFSRWSVAELHDAMESHFSNYGGGWPKWHMWCLLAGSFDSLGTGGIMFDAGAAYGGSGEPPERQGCAVFRNHSWFNNLVANPSNETEAAAMRKYLYTYVHEIGHAFNFLHSWDKARPDSLSWMNYDWKYDARNGTDQFWKNFRMQFDTEELIHIRHGNRAAVIMGGDPWASGGHLDDKPHMAMSQVEGDPPIELRIRSKPYFRFLEPVKIELRLKNQIDIPVTVDTNLNPEFGGVLILIKRPNGEVVEYSPLMCQLAEPEMKELEPGTEKQEGMDRHSENIFLSYGGGGHYFSEPGQYLVRAYYQGEGNLLIMSNLHSISIGRPFSPEEEQLASDYYTKDAGIALSLGGSASPFLKGGMKTLESILEHSKDTAVGAQLALQLADNLGRAFHRLSKSGKKLRKYRDAKVEDALALTELALTQEKKEKNSLVNLDCGALFKTKAKLLSEMGRKSVAKSALKEGIAYLKSRGVNKPVLESYAEYQKAL